MKRTRTPGEVVYVTLCQLAKPRAMKPWGKIPQADRHCCQAIGRAVLLEYFDATITASGIYLDAAEQQKENEKNTKTITKARK